MPLDPQNLTPASSVNRVRIAGLPGVHVDEGVLGATAWDLLKLRALADLVRQHSSSFAVNVADPPDRELPFVLNDALTSDDARARAVADYVCATYGRRLGYVLAVLERGDALNRESRAEWDGSYWDRWASIRRVWLGGGLASGEMGRRFAHHATQVLHEAGVLDCDIVAAEHSSFLPLIGAARAYVGDDWEALVADFGQTNLKSGIANYDRGTLVALKALGAVASPAGGPTLAEDMASLLASRLRERPDARNVMISVASYIRDNHPFSYDLTPYASLFAFTRNLGAWLSARLGELVGRDVQVRLLHDGSAAARTYAGTPHAAVIMLGSALGVGFPPDTSSGLKAFAQEFRVV